MDPARTGTRGRPNVNVDFLSIEADKNSNFPLLVWQTYRHKNELFPAGGQTAPSFDSSAPAYKYDFQPTAAGYATYDLFNNLDESSEIGLCNMFAHTNVRIVYEAKVNRTEFDYANKNGFTTAPAQIVRPSLPPAPRRAIVLRNMVGYAAPIHPSSRSRAAMQR
jgi:hypothetical protein